MTQDLKERTQRKMNRRGKPTLLIVEDHEELRNHYRELFGDYFKMFDTGMGEEALTLFRTLAPEVVLLDVNLEGTASELQGPALLKIMKEESPETLVCMMTFDFWRKEELLSEGADFFTNKLNPRGELFDFFISKGLIEPIQDKRKAKGVV